MNIKLMISKASIKNSNLGRIGENLDNLAKNKTLSKQVEKNVTLPAFHSTGRSMVFFNKIELGSNAQKVMAEITNTKAAIKALEESTGTSKSSDVTEAYQKISNHNWWQSVKDRTYREALEKAEAAQKKEDKSHMLGTRWFTSDDGVYSRKMDEYYYDSDYKNNLSSDEVGKHKAIINAYETIANTNETSRLAQIKALKEKLAALEKNLDFSSVRDDINTAMTSTGGIEDRIAGYEDVKDEIKRVFVEPLVSKNPDVHVPSSVMLYGATGCGKTTFLNAIKSQSKDHAEVVDISTGITNTGSFETQLETYLEEAKQRYIDTEKRTIILLNEAEKFLCMGKEDMGKSGMLLDESDKAKIKKYNEVFKCSNNVTFFKSILDSISKVPIGENETTGKAATIFITSNYPHLVHRDLLSRDGKYGKLMHIAVKPAADNDLKAVMKHYFKKHSDFIEKIKMYSKKDNYADLINSIPGISDKGRATLISKVKDGTIENMHIDPTCSEFPNFDAFIKGNNPSLSKGAYSNARIQNIADKAFFEYLKNPTITYEKHFTNIKNERGQDITPEAYRYFKDIYEMVQNPNKFKEGKTTISEDVIQFMKEYQDGLLTEKDMKKFELRKQDIQSRYNELKSKADLTEAEKASIKQYQEFLDAANGEDI